MLLLIVIVAFIYKYRYLCSENNKNINSCYKYIN